MLDLIKVLLDYGREYPTQSAAWFLVIGMLGKVWLALIRLRMRSVQQTAKQQEELQLQLSQAHGKAEEDLRMNLNGMSLKVGSLETELEKYRVREASAIEMLRISNESATTTSKLILSELDSIKDSQRLITAELAELKDNDLRAESRIKSIESRLDA